MSKGCRVCGCQIFLGCRRVAVCVGVEHCSVGACTVCASKACRVCVTKACSVCGSVRFVGCQKLVVCGWFEACRCICMYVVSYMHYIVVFSCNN